jgi:hypothetical protein
MDAGWLLSADHDRIIRCPKRMNRHAPQCDIDRAA